MLDSIVMIVLAGGVIAIATSIGMFVFSKWKTARSPSRQRPPEKPTEEWIDREAANAKATVDR
jgi:hypothetical protein